MAVAKPHSNSTTTAQASHDFTTHNSVTTPTFRRSAPYTQLLAVPNIALLGVPIHSSCAARWLPRCPRHNVAHPCPHRNAHIHHVAQGSWILALVVRSLARSFVLLCCCSRATPARAGDVFHTPFKEYFQGHVARARRPTTLNLPSTNAGSLCPLPPQRIPTADMAADPAPYRKRVHMYQCTREISSHSQPVNTFRESV